MESQHPDPAQISKYHARATMKARAISRNRVRPEYREECVKSVANLATALLVIAIKANVVRTPDAWLETVVGNGVADFVRSLPPEATKLSEETVSTTVTVEDQALRRHLLDRLVAYPVWFVRHLNKEITLSDIAITLDISIASIRTVNPTR